MSENTRLPTHLEVSGLIKLAQSMGAFGTVLQKGERDAGTLVVLTTLGGHNSTVWERMPRLDGTRVFVKTREQSAENPSEIDEYLSRRRAQDPDCWFIELDGPEVERLIDPARR